MKTKHHRLRNILLILFGSIFAIVVLVIAFISPITKYLVEKYDGQFLGRQITMDYAYVNPFSGYVYFNALKIFEINSDSVAFSAAGLAGHLALRKLVSKEYEITDLTLDRPNWTIIQTKKDRFNFSDIIEKFSAKQDEPKEHKAPVHFNLLDVAIKDGVFHFREKMTPVNYFIKNVTIESSGLRWNADTIANKFSFNSGIGSGYVKGHFVLNTATSDYKMDVQIKRFDLKIIEQYLKDLTNYGSFRAVTDANVKAQGNFKDGKNVNASGMVTVSDFHFGKSLKEDYASFDKFILNVTRLNPQKRIYEFDSISLTRPFFKYERYDNSDNIETIFGKEGARVKATASNPEKFNLIIELARYVKLLATNFFRSDYKIKRLAIYKGDIRYNDYSINEKFSITASPLDILADSISKNKRLVTVTLNSGIQPYGNLAVQLKINPNDSSDFKLDYHLDKMNATLLNPYLISFTSYPLDRGAIAFKGVCNVNNGQIQSVNHLLIIDPRITKRIKNKNNQWLPLRVMMFFVRERGNAIDYQIPVTGNLKDPNFHFRDVFFDILTNVFVKPATTIYRSEVKTVENKIEKTLAFNWEFGRASLMPDQEKFVKEVVGFLKDHPQASIVAQPIQYAVKEQEYILFFEAKKKQYLAANKKEASSFTIEDSITVAKMSVKDPAFVKHIQKYIKEKRMFTIQEKCEAYVGASVVDKKFKELMRKREVVFKNYFKDDNLSERLTIKDSENQVPFNGFSYYKISYMGEVPEELMDAFSKLKELDNEPPRLKLKEERKKTQRLFKIKHS